MFVALGITGCIGACKCPELIRHFQQAGHEVQVAATRHGLEFVTALTLETLSRHPVISEMFHPSGDWEVEHIALARRAAVLCVAPATADILAKFAHGIADDFLSTLYLSSQIPVVVAPAMNHAMWAHSATRENLAILRRRGVIVAEPDSGYLACGETGQGRLADLDVIVESVQAAVIPKTLAGRTVLVTAGPTAEDIDPVRFLTNRSTGRMGIALAREAVRRGARVILVAGPTTEKIDFPVTLEPVRRAAEMAAAVTRYLPETDVLLMSAAVADYTPAVVNPAKIKKSRGPWRLELERTEDILAAAGRSRREGQVLVGFAAETENMEENAERKLKTKHADLIVANPVGMDRGFGAGPNDFTLIGRKGVVGRLAGATKAAAAAGILDQVERLLAESEAVSCQ